jgi:hypothetical protein
MPALKVFRVTRIDPKIFSTFKSACAYYDLDMRQVLIDYMAAIAADYEWALSHKLTGTSISVTDLFRMGYDLAEQHMALGDNIKPNTKPKKPRREKQ